MKNLRELRLARSLTQTEVAAELGVTRQAYSTWELGTACPSLKAAEGLADVLGVTLDGLAGIEREEVVSELSWTLSGRSGLDDEGRELLRSLVRFAVAYARGGGR